MTKDSQENRPYRDTSRLTRFVRWLLGIFVALEAAAAVVDVAKLRAGDVVFFPAYRASLLGMVDVSDDILQTAVFAISGVMVLRWIYFANFNARAHGAKDLQFTPAWSIGWYFVPVLSYWKPYQAMKEIWRASANPFAWKSVRVSRLLPLWWVMWLSANVVGYVSLRLSFTLYDRTAAAVAGVADLLQSLINIPLSLVLARIIAEVNGMQSRESLDEIFGAAPVGGGTP